MRIVKFLIYYLLGVLGIIAIGNAPILLSGKSFLDISTYITSTFQLIKELVQFENWTYMYLGRELNILTFLWDPYVYSMKLLGGAALLGFATAILLAIITLSLPKQMINFVKRSLGLIEAVPDVMVAFMLQMLAVYIFKQTDIVIRFVTLGDERLYLAPILVLSFLPMISLYRVVVLLIEEELTKQYVDLALSKGLKNNTVVIIHVLRNIVKSVFYHTKIIIWALLSSLFIIEYMFNINGISSFVLQDFRPMVITVVLLMLFTPLFLIYQGAEFFIFKQAFEADIVQNKRKKKRRSWKSWVIWSLISRVFKEFSVHLKNPKFLFGFLVIFGILVYSFIHTFVNEEPVTQFILIYDEEGNLLSSKPHPPSEYVKLGTDRLGFSIWDQIVTGAKYTILFASVIAFLRMLLGFLLAIPFAMFLKDRWKKSIEKFVDSMHFLPMSIIALVLLTPILTGTTSGFQYTFMERLIMQGVILTILVVPLVTVLIGNEIKLIMKQEFIAGAMVLGGNTKHIVSRHLMPHLGSKLGIIFGQQFIQVLLVLIHLGFFKLFLGGTSVMYNAVYKAPEHSVTFEWSGLISSTRYAIMTGQYWIIVPVFIAFTILIISMQLIVEGIQEVQERRVGVGVVRNKKNAKFLKFNKRQKIEPKPVLMNAESFHFAKPKDQEKCGT